MLTKIKAIEWVKSNNKGINMEIHEDGRNISSGEKQLIAIARVLLKNCIIKQNNIINS